MIYVIKWTNGFYHEHPIKNDCLIFSKSKSIKVETEKVDRGSFKKTRPILFVNIALEINLTF